MPIPQFLRHIRRTGRIALICLPAVLVVPGSVGASGPSITPVLQGTLGANGWYRSNVTVKWQISPIPAASSGCDAVTVTADTTGKALTCSATWSDGSSSTSITVRKVVRIDRSPPRVSPGPDRRPDANGWYNHALGVNFSGVDATSGVASCARVVYSGPDSTGAVLHAGCKDRAGNSGVGSFSLKYDATAPTFARVSVAHGDGAVTLRWRTSPDVRVSEVTRERIRPHGSTARVYRGEAKSMRDRHLRVGRAYHYRVTIWDAAANSVSRLVAVTATGALTRPVPAARITHPPRLTWLPVYHAAFYNVQLLRGHRKVLSAWPTQTHLRLGRSWYFRGRHYHLRPGVYRWFVWPGYHDRGSVRYGRLLGGSSFVIR